MLLLGERVWFGLLRARLAGSVLVMFFFGLLEKRRVEFMPIAVYLGLEFLLKSFWLDTYGYSISVLF